MYMGVPKGYAGLVTKSRHITGKAQHIAYICEISSVKNIAHLMMRYGRIKRDTYSRGTGAQSYAVNRYQRGERPPKVCKSLGRSRSKVRKNGWKIQQPQYDQVGRNPLSGTTSHSRIALVLSRPAHCTGDPMDACSSMIKCFRSVFCGVLHCQTAGRSGADHNDIIIHFCSGNIHRSTTPRNSLNACSPFSISRIIECSIPSQHKTLSHSMAIR